MSYTHKIESTPASPKGVGAIQTLLDSDAVQDNDTIELKGRFDYAPTDVLYLYKSVTLKGDPVAGATIGFGRQLLWGRDKSGVTTPIAATIDNITFDGFTAGAIRICGAKGINVISKCSFLNYRYGVKVPGVLEGAWPIVAQGSGQGGSVTDLTGSLTISGCHFGVPDASSIPLDSNGKNNGMNNLLHVNNCALKQLVIKENVIDDMYWMGIAVFGIRGMTEIVDNVITKKSSWTARPGSGTGILFGLRPGSYPMDRDGSLRIERNTINIEAPDSYGIVVGLYPESVYLPLPAGETVPERSITVRDNVIRMQSVNASGVKDDRAALACMGACSNATWTNNVVTGSAQAGILVTQDVPSVVAPSFETLAPATAAPTKNTFENNWFAGGKRTNPTNGQPEDFDPFTASQAQAFAGPAAGMIELRSNAFGPVSGSNFLGGPFPLKRPCAGVVWCGYNGTIFLNDFSSSGIPGWSVAQEPGDGDGQPKPAMSIETAQFPHRLGCIYLAEMSTGNEVIYRESDFPKGTIPKVEHQILDLSTPNTIKLLKKLVPEEKPRQRVGPPEPPQPKKPIVPVLKRRAKRAKPV